MATDSSANAPGAEPGSLGLRLRQARQTSGLSLRELARQLGVSASFVSQLENGKSQPSVATLYSLAQVLDVSIDRLFDPRSASDDTLNAAKSAHSPTGKATRVTRRGSSEKSGEAAPISRSHLGSPADAWPESETPMRLSVTAAADRPRLVMDSGVIWEQLARFSDHNLDFIEIIYPPGSSSTNDDRMLRHDGYEYGYLLEGELQVTFGFEVVMLKAGESLGLDSSVPHLFKNLGSIPARGVWCVHHRHT